MLDCERQVMKSLSNEQLIYIIEQIRVSLYDMPSIDSRTLPAYIDMKLGKITPKEFRCILYGTC